MPMNTCGVSSARTRRTVTPSIASSTSSTAALDAVSRALAATPASALRSARPGSQTLSRLSALTVRTLGRERDDDMKAGHHSSPGGRRGFLVAQRQVRLVLLRRVQPQDRVEAVESGAKVGDV